jgi:hypothetical protein
MLAAAICVAAIGGLAFWLSRAGPAPELVFKGYENSAINSNQYAKFELRNTSRLSIWLYCECSGGETYFGFLPRGLGVSSGFTSPANPVIGTLVWGVELRPGQRRDLGLQLHAGDQGGHRVLHWKIQGWE